MRIGAIADIHANWPAFEAVLEDMPQVDQLVCAGDVVGYYPWPARCIDAVRERDLPTVMGNHDRAVASGTSFRFNAMARAGVEYASGELSHDQRTWLEALPSERTLLDGRVTIVHGHPDDPDHYTYPGEFGPDLLNGAELLVLGHTHVQHGAVYEEGMVVNPGSVGQPRDSDPRAAYALIDLEERTINERRVDYDIERVEQAVRDAGLPQRVAARLREGR